MKNCVRSAQVVDHLSPLVHLPTTTTTAATHSAFAFSSLEAFIENIFGVEHLPSAISDFT